MLKVEFLRSQIGHFVCQNIFRKEEAFISFKRYVYQQRFSIQEGRFIKQNEIVNMCDFFCHFEDKTSLQIIEPWKGQK